MSSKKENRRRGRPAKNSETLVNWDAVDSLLVEGEQVETDNGVVTGYPTYRDLAGRFGVSHSLIGKYAAEHNCLERRKQNQKRARSLANSRLSEFRAHELALKSDDIIRAIERYMVDFEEALVEGRVRCDNPADYNTMVRLRAFVEGDADSRSEIVAGVSLEELEQRHGEMLKSFSESSSPVRGEVIKLPVKEDDTKDSR